MIAKTIANRHASVRPTVKPVLLIASSAVVGGDFVAGSVNFVAGCSAFGVDGGVGCVNFVVKCVTFVVGCVDFVVGSVEVVVGCVTISSLFISINWSTDPFRYFRGSGFELLTKTTLILLSSY